MKSALRGPSPNFRVIVCADMPEMDEFTAHIFAAMAQRERKLFSSRTRDGLAALKVRGVTKKGKPVRLGNPRNGTEEQTARANAGAKRKADAYAKTVIGEIHTREPLQRRGGPV